jgi:hypothetical protein
VADEPSDVSAANFGAGEGDASELTDEVIGLVDVGEHEVDTQCSESTELVDPWRVEDEHRASIQLDLECRAWKPPGLEPPFDQFRKADLGDARELELHGGAQAGGAQALLGEKGKRAVEHAVEEREHHRGRVDQLEEGPRTEDRRPGLHTGQCLDSDHSAIGEVDDRLEVGDHPAAEGIAGCLVVVLVAPGDRVLDGCEEFALDSLEVGQDGGHGGADPCAPLGLGRIVHAQVGAEQAFGVVDREGDTERRGVDAPRRAGDSSQVLQQVPSGATGGLEWGESPGHHLTIGTEGEGLEVADR